MRILFAATPAIAVPTLRALVAQGYGVEVLTNPPAPTGRGGRLAPSAIDVEAMALGLLVHREDRLDAAVRLRLEGRFDLLVSYAFGKIFGPKFLGLFPRGGLNIHPSLLPRWRGPSPLSAAIAAGDSETGLSVQKLALEMDTGDLVYQSRRPLDGTETTASLTQWAADEAPAALLGVLAALEAGTLVATPQSGEVTTCSLVRKSDGVLDWSRSARELDAQIRSCNPWPGATTLWNGQVLTLWDSRHRDESLLSDSPASRPGRPELRGESLLSDSPASRPGRPEQRGESLPSDSPASRPGRPELRGESLPSDSPASRPGRAEQRGESLLSDSPASRPGRVLMLDKNEGILIKTGDGLLVARELQLPARKSLDYRSFVNGSPGLIGSLLGDTP